jgi:hypothetical protein
MRATMTSGSVPFLFLTPKSARAILVADPLLHDVLRQAALDQAVSRIEYVRSVMLENSPYAMNCVMLVRSGFSEIVDLCPPMREPGEDALFAAAAKSLKARVARITKDSVLREPRCSNSRLVWTERYRYVPFEVRGRILQQLRTHGPTTIERIGSDLKNAVFVLACEAALHIDIDSQRIESAQISAS